MGRKRVNEFVEQSFTNSIGQTINPGDKVVAVTTGYGHSVSVFEGVFEGVYRRPSSDKVSGTRVGQVPVRWNERVFAEDGEHEEEKFQYKYDQNSRYAKYEYVKTGRRYNLIPNVKYRKSSLQRNRVFKIETPLSEVSI